MNIDLQKEILDLKSQLAATKARLAEYEVGYDPKVDLPEEYLPNIQFSVDVFVNYDVELEIEDNKTVVVHEKDFGHYNFYYKKWILEKHSSKAVNNIRWFPLPGKGGEE